MKASIRCPPWTRILYSMTLGLILSMTFAPVAVAGDVDAFCDRNPTHHKCTGGGDGGNEGDFRLTIDYFFDDAEPSRVIATGTKHCDELGHCSFKGDIEGDFAPFYLPDSLIGEAGLLVGTAWKGTPLVPDACFPNAYADAKGRGVELSYDFVTETWFAAIGSSATDVDGAVERKYVFYFLCDQGPCGNSDWGEQFSFSMAGDYGGAELLRIESPPKLDKKMKSTPCRCTISNEPPCPGDVGAPIPMMNIRVVSEEAL